MLYHWATEKLMQGEVQCFWTQDWNKCVKTDVTLWNQKHSVNILLTHVLIIEASEVREM